MKRKTKGSNAERELVHAFWARGWAAIRVAGSGSAHYPNPDVLAGKGSRRIAVECKATKELKKYLSKEDINQLRVFSEKFGAEPWIGVRFDDLKWFFLGLEDLEETESGFAISIGLAKRKGVIIDELTNES